MRVNEQSVLPILEYLRREKDAFVVFFPKAALEVSARQLQRAYGDAREGMKFYTLVTGRDVIYPKAVDEEEENASSAANKHAHKP